VPVHAAGLVRIGKEAIRLDDRDLVASLEELQSIYHDPRREPWITVVLPKPRMLATEPEGDDGGIRTPTSRTPRCADRSRPPPHHRAIRPRRAGAGCRCLTKAPLCWMW